MEDTYLDIFTRPKSKKVVILLMWVQNQYGLTVMMLTVLHARSCGSVPQGDTKKTDI